MKHLKSLLLSIAMTLASITASAYDFEVDGICYNVISEDEKTCEVTYKYDYFRSYSGDIVIPSTVSYNDITYPVTSIGESAFRFCESLTSVEIPNTVTSIGNNAFEDCAILTSIEIPNSVTFIGEWAFYNCSSLTSIVIPSSVNTIKSCMFWGCDGLTSIEIPSTVTSIENDAFAVCTNLASITIFAVTPPTKRWNSFGDVTMSTCIVRVPASAVEAYKSSWSDFANIVPIDGDEPVLAQWDVPTPNFSLFRNSE